MKKSLSLVLSFIMIITSVAALPFAANAITYNRPCGENVEYTFVYETGICTIKGTGPMYDFGENSNTSDFSSTTAINFVRIGEGVTYIGENAFYNAAGMQEIIIPSTVTSIGAGAFNGCNGLTTIFYNGTEDEWNNITVGANNTALSTATLNSVTSGKCGDDVTYSLNASTGVLTISGDGSVSGYEKGGSPFTAMAARINEVVMTGNIDAIGNRAFEGVLMTCVTIAGTVDYIGENAFNGCTKLTTVKFNGSQSAWDDISILGNNEPLCKIKPQSGTCKMTYIFNGGNRYGESVYVFYEVPSSLSVCSENFVDYMGVTPPKGMVLAGVEANGVKYDFDDYYEPTGDTVYKYLWQDKNYKISIDKATVSGIKTKTYTGKAIEQSPIVKLGTKRLLEDLNYEVTYKNNTKVGVATMTIKGIGYYKGTITKTFKINPKGTSLKKLTAGKKALTVTWNKKTAQTTGYQIQYSTYKNFKKGNKTVTITSNKTVKKTIKSLKAKKKYYVRIRTYKTVGKTKYYSSWSAAKSIKTK